MLKASFAKKVAAGLLGASAATGYYLTIALNADLLLAADHGLKPAAFPWANRGYVNTLDHASVRRGYEVYKQVCAACHSMRHTYYRQLVGVSHTEAEAKAEAAEVQVEDGPNDEGEMYKRPGKLSDRFQDPYPNEEAAKLANNGALPPDMSFMTMARHNGPDYLFSILTGYCDPPAGVEPKENLFYNPYFNGGFIAMRKALYDDIIEYSDGTPANLSQLAKDVTNFVQWSSEKTHDDRKFLILKTLIVSPLLIALFYVYKRRIFSLLKSRKLVYRPANYGAKKH